MNTDVISIIGQFSHIDLLNFEYKCEHCNENVENICCCIYSEENIFNGIFSSEIDFFEKIITYKYVYICQECYDKIQQDKDIFFFFRNLLHIDSFEQLFEQILNIEKQKNIKNCIFDNNIQVMEFNQDQDWFKSIFTIFYYNKNKIIESNFLYENNECLSKYFYGLSTNEQIIFNDFKVLEYLELIQN